MKRYKQHDIEQYHSVIGTRFRLRILCIVINGMIHHTLTLQEGLGLGTYVHQQTYVYVWAFM